MNSHTNNHDRQNNILLFLQYIIEHIYVTKGVELLIDNLADINMKDENSNTLLHFAIIHMREKELIEILINKGADVNAKDSNSRTPLHYAIIRSNGKEIIELLIRKGANVNAEDTISLTPLHYAIIRNSGKEIIELLIRKGANVNAEAFYLTTPLFCAIMYFNNIEIIELLINNGADVNHEITESYTPLSVAIKYKRSIEVIDLLIKRGAHPIKASASLFDQYIIGKDNNLINYIFKRLNSIHIDLETALKAGLPRESIDILLKRGVNINLTDLSLLIIDHQDYEYLKEIKSFKKTKRFFIQDDLSNEENRVYYQVHDNSPIIREQMARIFVLMFTADKKGKAIECLLERYDIDLKTKTNKSDWVLVLNAYYFYQNNYTIPKFREDIIIPKYLSFDYAEIFIETGKITKYYKINRGIAFSIIKQIKEDKYQDDEDECGKTEKGNTAIHIQGVFNRNDKKIKTKKKFIDEYIDNNGWTPLFTSTFRDNPFARQYFYYKTLNREYVDYFGNNASFYELKQRKK